MQPRTLWIIGGVAVGALALVFVVPKVMAYFNGQKEGTFNLAWIDRPTIAPQPAPMKPTHKIAYQPNTNPAPVYLTGRKNS